MLAIKRHEPLWADTERGPHQVPAKVIAAQIPTGAWRHLSARAGSKGPRVYAWALCPIRLCRGPERGHWLLLRRSLSDPTDLAYYACYGSPITTLSEPVRVDGRRWTIEEGFERAKGEVGLDHYEVRRYVAWFQRITLALLADVYLEVTRRQASLAHGP